MNVLVFGASGTLGTAIVQHLKSAREHVWTVSRNSSSTDFQSDDGMNRLLERGHKFDACIWAQGMNAKDSIAESESFDQVFEANIGYTISTLRTLLSGKMLAESARLVVISSIWQEISRNEKFSYTVSKSAVKGLVNSFIADYSPLGFSMNAILPGVVDTPMTRANLNKSQIANITNETPGRKLVTPENVAKAAYWLASSNSMGINGEFIRIDNGWSQVRAI
jgi:NAD(P)-dependent dehydrogenase (short-subunit alcohol dehydrogenase family)